MTGEDVLKEILLGEAFIQWEQHVVDGEWVRRENARLIIDGHIPLSPEAAAWIDNFYEEHDE